MLIAYSKKKNGNQKLSTNFKVKEFACKDGADTVFVNDDLVNLLQKVRNHFGKAVHITSAYRTDAYNKKVGGANYSQHLYGNAADIYITGIQPEEIYNYLDSEYPNSLGLGKYSSFVHVDVRASQARWNG